MCLGFPCAGIIGPELCRTCLDDSNFSPTTAWLWHIIASVYMNICQKQLTFKRNLSYMLNHTLRLYFPTESDFNIVFILDVMSNHKHTPKLMILESGNRVNSPYGQFEIGLLQPSGLLSGGGSHGWLICISCWS